MNYDIYMIPISNSNIDCIKTRKTRTLNRRYNIYGLENGIIGTPWHKDNKENDQYYFPAPKHPTKAPNPCQ